MRVSGNKIKEFREGQKWTTTELALKCEPPVTRQAIEAWEKNGVGGFKTLNKIAKALRIPPAMLLDSENSDE
jgi:transcriptional regulator with XRE-family HTH domain